MYSILGNIERIGDHAMNLAEYAQTIQEKNLNFSDYAKNEFKVMDESCALELLRKAAAGDSDFTLEKIQAIEQKIDDITDNFRQNQIDRMREGHCNVESSILYSEMLTDYERIGDHMLNIGEAYDVIQWNNDILIRRHQQKVFDNYHLTMFCVHLLAALHPILLKLRKEILSFKGCNASVPAYR